MDNKVLVGLVAGLLLAALIYLNFSWGGPGGLEQVEWMAEGEPSWIEWVFSEASE